MRPSAPLPRRALAGRALLAALAALGALTAPAACTRDTAGLRPAPFPADGGVFVGGTFARNTDFQGFSGTSPASLGIDSTVTRAARATLRITVPDSGDPSGAYAGGAFVGTVARDLTGYDALTFWARASRAATLDVAGLGNDNSGTASFTAEARGLALATTWQRYVVPIPLAGKLTQERGLFYFADGPDGGRGYTIWLDDVRFERVGISRPRATLAAATATTTVGATRPIGALRVTYDVGGRDQTVIAGAGYFTFTSSDPTVATVDAGGTIRGVGPGAATITAMLGPTPVAGAVTLRAIGAPTTAPAAPTRAAADVLALFSDAYRTVPVSTWSAPWDQADVADVTVGGTLVKRYSGLGFAGIEFTQPTLDATAMTTLHLDVYALDDQAFRLKLVDFGADGAFGGGDDSEHEITLSGTSSPKVTVGEWSALDLPLSAFTGLRGRARLAQMILSSSSGTIWVDNVYFWRAPTAPPPAAAAPATAPPAPTYAAGDVVALLAAAYPTVPVDTWSASWDQADLTDVQVGGAPLKRYSNLVFAGIEFTSRPIDARAMTALRLDLWTPDPTATATLRIKLVDFGANGAFGGGDDVEHELVLSAATVPALRTGEWVTLDLPLARFTGLTTRGHLAQLIVASDQLRTVWLGNVLLHR